jgi:hypothetical protein
LDYYNTRDLINNVHFILQTFGQASPVGYRHGVYILAIANHDPITVPEFLTGFSSQQAEKVNASVCVWLVNRNSVQHTNIEEQHMIFDQV